MRSAIGALAFSFPVTVQASFPFGTIIQWHWILFYFVNFNWRLITLQYCSAFCHTMTWISHGCTCVPYPEPPSHLPPHPIPQGHPSAPGLSILSLASNLDRRSISHIVIYMFQCSSLKSSHPCLLPQSPKVCSLYLCLFCCLAYRGHRYHLSKFHIYALIYSIFLFLPTYFSLYNRFQDHLPHFNWLKCISFHSK